MIPTFNHSHVLPPYAGDSPKQAALSSPYETSAIELVSRLGSTRERRALLSGLFAYRQALRDLGFAQGFQWLDGSFVENIEAFATRAPNDIDVVTFAYKPRGMDATQVTALMNSRTDVFVPAQARQHFHCDAYVVPLDGRPERLVAHAAYYQTLFSHRRGDNVWKGLLMLPLQSDDAAATAQLSCIAEGEDDAATA